MDAFCSWRQLKTSKVWMEYQISAALLCDAGSGLTDQMQHTYKAGMAPRGILLETPADIARAAREIYLQAGVTTAMPPANVSYMEEDERALIRRWYRAAGEDVPFGLAMN